MIADYFNRKKLVSTAENVEVSGALLGSERKNKIHCKNLFEFKFKETEIDFDFMKDWKEISLQKFPEDEIFGVFIAREGDLEAKKADFILVESLKKLGIFNPVVFLLNVAGAKNLKNSYAAFRFVEGEACPVEAEVGSDDSENISFRSISMENSSLVDQTAVENNLRIYQNSLSGLSSALEKIIAASKEEKYAKDPKFQGMVNKLLNNRIKFSSSDFKKFLEGSKREALIYSNVSSAAMTTNYMGRIS